jgi:alginate O-acetyltransferase complex protein AlgI
MAIGLARMVGFEFHENFNFPYAARSLTDLWKRWHISLTTFFRNYVYIPLGGRKKGKVRTLVNLLFVFLLTGLWHGASWNCILWGLFTGLFLVLEKIVLLKWLNRLPYRFANVYTLFIFITALMIFKIEQGEHLADVLNKAFFINRESSGIFFPTYYLTPDLYFLLALALLFAYPIHERKWYRFLEEKLSMIPLIRELSMVGLFVLTLIVMSSSVYNPFIYFKF